MSDIQQGPDWWQASDGRWYPPAADPSAQPAAPASGFTPTPVYAHPRTSGLAITSLVLGILSLVTCVTGVPGLITGIIAKRQIRESNGAETGEGLATGGIITSAIGLGLTVLFVLLIFAVTFLGRSATSRFSFVGSAVSGN